jgi:hypothetical protein
MNKNSCGRSVVVDDSPTRPGQVGISTSVSESDEIVAVSVAQ